MKRFSARCISVVLIFVLACSVLCVSSYAYADYYPNTHRNTGNNIEDIVGVAKTQIGYTELDTSTGLPISPDDDYGYTKYGASFGEPCGHWCAYFVSWCAGQAGIPSSVVPRLGNCGAIIRWFTSRNCFCYRSSGYVPKAGDFVLYDWDCGTSPDHIGLVTGCDGSTFYTIEGNTGGAEGYRCEGKSKSLSSPEVIGFCTPNYNDRTSYHGSFAFVSSSATTQSIAYSTNKLCVKTTTASEIKCNDAVLNGSFENTGHLLISSYGFLFGSEKDNLDKYSAGGSDSSSNLDFSLKLSQHIDFKLKPSTTYYYKSYVTVSGRDYVGPTYAVVTVSDKPKQVLLSHKGINVGIGQTYELAAMQTPEGSVDKGLSWTSADTGVATVADGIITGVGFGETVITVTSNYGNVSNTCAVDVLIPSPENFKAENVSPDKVHLTFSPVDNAGGYIINKCEGTDNKPVEYKRLSSKTTELFDKVEPGKKYCYSVSTIADDEQYNSDPSDMIYVNAVLGSPENVSAKPGVFSSVLLTWSAVDDADYYTVYRSESEGGLFTIIGKSYFGSFIDFTAECNQKYFYKICSCSNKREIRLQSGFSDSVYCCPSNDENCKAFNNGCFELLQNKSGMNENFAIDSKKMIFNFI